MAPQTRVNCQVGSHSSGALPPFTEVGMDPAPIIILFDQLITLGSTIALVVCAFFVMIAGTST